MLYKSGWVVLSCFSAESQAGINYQYESGRERMKHAIIAAVTGFLVLMTAGCYKQSEDIWRSLYPFSNPSGIRSRESLW